MADRYHIEERFILDPTEALYGLSQHQSGMFNYRGSTVELAQNNTDIAIPLVLSSKGYGILWNTASFSYADNRFPPVLNLESLASDQIDYYLIYGPEMDQIIHQYRIMTGHTPLLPQWSYGLFQSKDRYVSQTEMLYVASQYRSRHIPIDRLVQDWFWWTNGGEGDPEFNSNHTHVPAEFKTLHEEHVHAMLSVWGLMDETAKNYQEIKKRGFEIDDTHVYDPTNRAGRDFYWNNLAGKLFAERNAIERGGDIDVIAAGRFLASPEVVPVFTRRQIDASIGCVFLEHRTDEDRRPEEEFVADVPSGWLIAKVHYDEDEGDSYRYETGAQCEIAVFARVYAQFDRICGLPRVFDFRAKGYDESGAHVLPSLFNGTTPRIRSHSASAKAGSTACRPATRSTCWL